MVTLATKHWSRVSVHKVVLAFLIAERATNVAQAQRDAPDLIASLDVPKLLDMPDLSDPEQNHDKRPDPEHHADDQQDQHLWVLAQESADLSHPAHAATNRLAASRANMLG